MYTNYKPLQFKNFYFVIGYLGYVHEEHDSVISFNQSLLCGDRQVSLEIALIACDMMFHSCNDAFVCYDNCEEPRKGSETHTTMRYKVTNSKHGQKHIYLRIEFCIASLLCNFLQIQFTIHAKCCHNIPIQITNQSQLIITIIGKIMYIFIQVILYIIIDIKIDWRVEYVQIK